MHVELVVHGGDEDGCRFLMQPGDRMVIGRSSKVDIRLTHTRISRRHAELFLAMDGLHVVDLGSRNGTVVAGRELEPESQVLVPAGRAIRMGPYRIEHVLIDVDEARHSQTRQWRASDTRAIPDGYELTGLLGEGGQSRVWAARRHEDGEQVAIKILRTQADEEDRSRFEREGEVVTRIASEFVVQAYDAGVSDGRPFLVMELVQGASVGAMLKHGPLQLPLVLRVAEDLARALVAAHLLDVIHRDVKPGNVMLTGSGRAKLADFGMAKISAQSQLTQTGVGLGSLPYVPPEQAMQARDADARSDLYGLGTTIFHMVAGKPPFQAPKRPNAEQIRRSLEAIVHEAPPELCDLRTDCPRALSDLVAELLAKDPHARPDSAQAVADRLRALREQLYPNRDSVREDRSSETHTNLSPYEP